MLKSRTIPSTGLWIPLYRKWSQLTGICCERTWWKLFQKNVASIKLDLYDLKKKTSTTSICDKVRINTWNKRTHSSTVKQSVIIIQPESLVLLHNVASVLNNASFMTVFSLTWPMHQPKTYQTRGEPANHLISNVVSPQETDHTTHKKKFNKHVCWC